MDLNREIIHIRANLAFINYPMNVLRDARVCVCIYIVT